MEILEFNPFELKDCIDEGTLISDKGFSSCVFLYGNNLIKLKKTLYQDLKVNIRKFAERRVNDIYRWDKTPFVDPKQIEYLQEKQKDIKLTKFDKGIVKVNDIVCGSILENFLDYSDLTDIDGEDYLKILKILKNILLSLRELELNNISHLDLAKSETGKKPTINILYKGTDTKLIDVSGKFITYGSNFEPELMYEEYESVLRILLDKIIRYHQEFKSIDVPSIRTYTDAVNINQALEKKLVK